ncbi:MAG: glycerol dehydrogenase [Candidatus Odinarchaeum yellowstonii]|uniref:Glycerol dehydrogenase n=1 Tax=Odinarchaeota yellowstonii (strain LCB_4) TaxID=1841599 RepID=A0AAF0IAE0_ODILC|nr:MAG: glycerol dehydrogenase [Candidatus Odinarchaeum yellowstonii]
MVEIPKILVSPARYVQGRGAIYKIGEQVKLLGKKAVIFGGPTAMKVTGDIITESLKKNGVEVVHKDDTVKECTHNTINRLASIGTEYKADIVIGIGGGKSADTAKAVAAKMKAHVVTVPTQCATNADASGLSVVYTEKHEFVEYLFHPKNPDLVLVDSEILAKAPPQFITWGMGDALACMFEADACAAQPNAKNIPGGRSTAAAVALTHLCFENLMTYGVQAAKDAKKQLLTPAVEKIIESVKLLSCLGFESSGLAAAHATHNGLTIVPGLHVEHGQLVAFCTITQLILEGRAPEEIESIVSWVHEIGLPITLKELGIGAASENDLMKAAEKACDPHDTMGNMPLNITPQMVKDAILATDAIGTEYHEKCGCGH